MYYRLQYCPTTAHPQPLHFHKRAGHEKKSFVSLFICLTIPKWLEDELYLFWKPGVKGQGHKSNNFVNMIEFKLNLHTVYCLFNERLKPVAVKVKKSRS